MEVERTSHRANISRKVYIFAATTWGSRSLSSKVLRKSNVHHYVVFKKLRIYNRCCLQGLLTRRGNLVNKCRIRQLHSRHIYQTQIEGFLSEFVHQSLLSVWHCCLINLLASTWSKPKASNSNQTHSTFALKRFGLLTCQAIYTNRDFWQEVK